MPLIQLLLYILACIILIGFFAGTEIAFISANKLNMELRKKQQDLSSRILTRFMDNPAEFIGSGLVGVNVLMVVYGLLASEAITAILSRYGIALSQYPKLVVDSVIATLIILIFAEFLPKAVFRTRAETVLTLFAVPMLAMYYIFYPVAKVFVTISEFLLKRVFKQRIKSNKKVFNKIDLEVFLLQNLQHPENKENEVSAELFENAMELANVKVRNCLIPRNEVEAVEIKTSIEEIKQMFIETKLSKILVYENTIDNIVGYVHHLDLSRNPTRLKDVIHKIFAVPEAMNAVDMLNRFTKERKSIAWVIDEFGGTAGIVTMEDVLEQIFGDINDEYDVEEHLEKDLGNGEFIFSGRLELDYLNEKYNLNFDTGVSETLSGFIITLHETIPKMNEHILIEDYLFDIVSVSNTRIETVKMKIVN